MQCVRVQVVVFDFGHVKFDTLLTLKTYIY